MLVALLRGKPAAVVLHHALRAAAHRPIVISPVLAQSWRPDPKTVHAFSQYLKDYTVPQERDSATPIRLPMPSEAAAWRTHGQPAWIHASGRGPMLAKALLPPKKRPDALVVVTAALHVPAQILTSDPEDIRAYTGTLDHADIITETI
jgi:hypothetical protein